jgi:hypothetical protein
MIARDVSQRMQIENQLRSEILQLKEENRLTEEAVVAAAEALPESLTALKDIIVGARTGVFGEISPRLKENLESAEDHIAQTEKCTSELHNVPAFEGIARAV